MAATAPSTSGTARIAPARRRTLPPESWHWVEATAFHPESSPAEALDLKAVGLYCTCVIWSLHVIRTSTADPRTWRHGDGGTPAFAYPSPHCPAGSTPDESLPITREQQQHRCCREVTWKGGMTWHANGEPRKTTLTMGEASYLSDFDVSDEVTKLVPGRLAAYIVQIEGHWSAESYYSMQALSPARRHC
ncbi:hypothetical protein BP6252_07813 [Coleophoma cylindrospora]|uniref:Uncharacterized protein n=1 Tax=Coleophoma cylindrospora TaxID=1849047 RepID=A0A3D8RB88_9HELO|nr:hypothetical protein BP6252_07813 [Coleophoma cylindrospora]